MIMLPRAVVHSSHLRRVRSYDWKSLSKASTPKVAVNLLFEENGGIENVCSSGDIARDRQQAANFRRDVKETENKIASSCSDPILFWLWWIVVS